MQTKVGPGSNNAEVAKQMPLKGTVMSSGTHNIAKLMHCVDNLNNKNASREDVLSNLALEISTMVLMGMDTAHLHAGGVVGSYIPREIESICYALNEERLVNTKVLIKNTAVLCQVYIDGINKNNIRGLLLAELPHSELITESARACYVAMGR